jgi:hypothetical protein
MSKNYEVDVYLDVPMDVHRIGHDLKPDEMPPRPKDYVMVQASSEDKECLEWFIEHIKDRAACIYSIEESEGTTRWYCGPRPMRPRFDEEISFVPVEGSFEINPDRSRYGTVEVLCHVPFLAGERVSNKESEE